MNSLTKKIVALVATLGLLYIAYYGSWLPLQKSEAFIDGLKKLSAVQNIEQFEALFDSIFTRKSPIGDEELVRNFVGISGTLISNATDPALVARVVQYVDKYYQPIVKQGKGMSYTQNLYALGRFYQIAFLRTQDPHYIQVAIQYYREGERLSPNRPQFLYGLFDMYRLTGDVTGVEEVSKKILTLWPSDTRINQALVEFADRVKAFEAQQKAAGKSAN